MNEYYPYNYQGQPVKQKFPETWPMPSEEVRDMRWQALRESMKSNNLDFLVITPAMAYMPTLTNQLCYISNYVAFANNGNYLVFPLEGVPRMAVTTELGPQFYHIALETSWIEDVVMGSDPVQDVIKIIKDMKLDKGKGGIVGYINGAFPAMAFDALREALPGVQFGDATPVFGMAQNEVSRKSQEELGYLRKASEILDKSYEAVAEILKPGVTERQLWAAAEKTIIEEGGWYAHFMIAAVGTGPTFLRGPATFKTLKQGDVVMFEINTIYAGISPQACFALSIGRPREDVEKMYKFCEELYPWTLEQLEKKKTFMEVITELDNSIHKAGYEPITPHIHLYNLSYKMPLESPPQPGDFFTVHPNCCNKEYSIGAKFGDAVRFTEEGEIERLNKIPAKLNIV